MLLPAAATQEGYLQFHRLHMPPELILPPGPVVPEAIRPLIAISLPKAQGCFHTRLTAWYAPKLAPAAIRKEKDACNDIIVLILDNTNVVQQDVVVFRTSVVP